MKRYSRRETEVLEALYRLGEASVGEIHAAIDHAPAYDSIRTTLRVLESKGAVKHRAEGRRFIYSPTVADAKAWKSTAQRMADVFFGGSLEDAALAMLKLSDTKITERDLKESEQRIEASRRKREKR